MSVSRSLCIFGLAASCSVTSAFADEDAIRKNLTAQLPSLAPIDEITKTPVNDLWEVRMGNEIIYSDDVGSFVIEGNIIDLKRQLNITQDRVAKLTAFDFAKLPLKDAVMWKQGTGARKLVVFADPNCSYCKHFEKELSSVKDITVYTFLIPILGGDSPEKSKAIWCAKDKSKVWRSWMLDGATPPAVAGACDASALDRNLALGVKHGVNGTPMLVFADSKRMPGIMTSAELDQKLSSLNPPL